MQDECPIVVTSTSRWSTPVNLIRRVDLCRRECLQMLKRFTTYERSGRAALRHEEDGRAKTSTARSCSPLDGRHRQREISPSTVETRRGRDRGRAPNQRQVRFRSREVGELVMDSSAPGRGGVHRFRLGLPIVHRFRKSSRDRSAPHPRKARRKTLTNAGAAPPSSASPEFPAARLQHAGAGRWALPVDRSGPGDAARSSSPTS